MNTAIKIAEFKTKEDIYFCEQNHKVDNIIIFSSIDNLMIIIDSKELISKLKYIELHQYSYDSTKEICMKQ